MGKKSDEWISFLNRHRIISGFFIGAALLIAIGAFIWAGYTWGQTNKIDHIIGGNDTDAHAAVFRKHIHNVGIGINEDTGCHIYKIFNQSDHYGIIGFTEWCRDATTGLTTATLGFDDFNIVSPLKVSDEQPEEELRGDEDEEDTGKRSVHGRRQHSSKSKKPVKGSHKVKQRKQERYH